MKKSKNVFIIGGANNLNVINHILNTDWKPLVGKDIKIDKFYCFEPLKELDEWVQKFNTDKIDAEIEFIKKAMWIEDGEVVFRRMGAHFSSTLCPDKKTGGFSEAYGVEAIDFSKWLKDNVSKNDFVICDLDIECSEYKILPHLIENKTIGLIDYLVIEWHKTKCGTWYADNEVKLEQDLHNHVKLLDHNRIGIGGQ
tara:strand:- start:2217 stop:2807 length:591 start_codon:yes stop_codon:yes gene_type:complete